MAVQKRVTTQSVRKLPMHRPVILTSNQTVKQAAHAMQSQNIGSVLINNREGHLLGILTDRDLAFAFAFKEIKSDDLIEKLMGAGKLVAVTETATLQDVVTLMREEGIRRVPVIRDDSDSHQRCIGVITLDDLIKSHLIEVDDSKAIIESQLEKPVSGQRPPARGTARSAFRHQDRRQHSYHRFISQIAGATDLSRGDARNLTLYAITAILRKVTPSEGKNLLSQLPYVLQAELMSEISFGGSEMTTDEIIGEISNRLGKNIGETKIILQKFWRKFGEVTTIGETRHIIAQLPREMGEIFAQGV